MDGPANVGNTDAGVMPNRLQLAMIGRELQDVARYAMPPRALQRVMFGLLGPLRRPCGYRGMNSVTGSIVTPAPPFRQCRSECAQPRPGSRNAPPQVARITVDGPPSKSGIYCGITLASRQTTDVRRAGPEPEHLLPLSADPLALTRVRPGWRLLS
jgi:hypothetical protein